MRVQLRSLLDGKATQSLPVDADVSEKRAISIFMLELGSICSHFINTDLKDGSTIFFLISTYMIMRP
jgi:hypothetical protein